MSALFHLDGAVSAGIGHGKSRISAAVKEAGPGGVDSFGGAPDSAVDSGVVPPAWEQPCLEQPLLVIVGPTASGKSALALFLAKRLNGEIINYDSVQLYRGLDIGSGKVSLAEKRQAPHHLLDIFEVGEVSSAGLYRRLALPVLAGIQQRRRIPILVGGTGLYLRALLEGLADGPQRSSELRSRLRAMAQRHNGSGLHRLLLSLDPDAAGRIHPNDEQKLVRAIEVCLLAGESQSTLHRRGREPLRGFNVFKAGLNPPRDELRNRIDRRVETMFAAGLLREVHAIVDRHPGLLNATPPLTALGYRQACAMLRGEMDQAAAISQAQAATRRYAKRQMTWWRRESEVTWFDGFGDSAEVQLRIYSWFIRILASRQNSGRVKNAHPRRKGLIHEHLLK